jgi:hypothetical protein
VDVADFSKLMSSMAFNIFRLLILNVISETSAELFIFCLASNEFLF